MKISEARAVVTGGASGLGNAVARHIVANGGRVTMLDVQEGPGQAAATELGASASFVKCDVTSETEVGAAMDSRASEDGQHQPAGELRGHRRRGPHARQERADAGRVLHQGGPHQPDRHVPVRQGRRVDHAAERAQCGWRAWPHHSHIVGRRVRGADRAGRLLRNEGRRDGHDAADRSRARAVRHSLSWPSRRASSTRR